MEEVKTKKKIYKKWWFWTIIIVAIAAVVGIAFAGGSNYPKDLIDLPEEEYKSQCQLYNYEDIARNPSEYEKKLAKFTGEIV